ncbi:MAG: cytochrome c oxidase assembly protein [Hyphomicrobiales bacterium]|nr:cytochrome c oxidase assembly protein [Hyphomicrobiales bacterium]
MASTDNTAPKGGRTRNGATALVLLGVVGGMVGLSFASVPLYQLFCKVTGYGGTPGRETAEQVHAAAPGARIIKVRFDSNVNHNLPWVFHPVKREVQTRVGEEVLAFYEARNISDRTTTGTATFNVTPFKVAPYFNKIECFCFTEQTLKPGQEASMPVSFFVDPEIFDDPATAEVTTITLSYTFFPAKPEPRATAAPEGLTAESPGS